MRITLHTLLNLFIGACQGPGTDDLLNADITIGLRNCLAGGFD